MTLRIAFVHHTAAPYGASNSLVNLVQGLLAYDVKPHVILHEPCVLSRTFEGLGVPVALVPGRWWVRQRGRVERAICGLFGERWLVARDWQDEEHVAQVAALLDAWRVDLVQSNASVLPTGFYAARRLGLPHIWHLRELVEHYRFSFELGERRSRQLMNSSEALIAISDCVARRYFLPGGAGLKRVIHNGVMTRADFDAARVRSLETPRPAGGFVFGMIGMIYPSKGFGEAVEAFDLVCRDYPQARLVIAGEGDVDLLKTQAARLGIADRVQFLGFVDSRTFYSGIDALLMCSRQEALGRVTIEANAALKPVIGLDDGGTSELIEHGRTGLLYRGGARGLAAAMREFLEDPERVRDMGLAAWEFACAGFTSETCAEQFYRLACEVAAGAARAKTA